MKKITIAMTVSAIFLVCILTTYGFLFSEKISGYTTLEADLEEAAQMYLDTEKIKLSSGQTMRLKASTLLELDLIENLNVEKDQCNGYVIANKKISNYTYKGYIKCNKYTTKGYE